MLLLQQLRLPRDDALNLASGACASAVARAVIAPLDVLKIRFQVQETARYTSIMQAVRTIVRREGVRAFWKGNLSAELMVVPYGALQFAAFHWFRTSVQPKVDAQHTRVLNLAAGAFSGVFSTAFTYPFDLIRTRMAAQHTADHSFMRTMADAIASRTMFRGIWPTIVGIIPYAALQFAVYEELQAFSKKFVLQQRDDASETLKGSVHFTCGFLAGIVSKMMTMPFDVIKKRFQTDGYAWHPDVAAAPPRNYRSIARCAADIVRYEGARALFKGTSVSLIKAAPNTATTFLFFELSHAWLERAVPMW